MTTKPTDQQRLIHALWNWIQVILWGADLDKDEWIPKDLHDELGNALITVDQWILDTGDDQ